MTAGDFRIPVPRQYIALTNMPSEAPLLIRLSYMRKWHAKSTVIGGMIGNKPIPEETQRMLAARISNYSGGWERGTVVSEKQLRVDDLSVTCKEFRGTIFQGGAEADIQCMDSSQLFDLHYLGERQYVNEFYSIVDQTSRLGQTAQ